MNEANWHTAPLEALLARQAQEAVGGEKSVLIVDDMSLLKAGRHSVGVARQYSGKAGKRENCQALVSLTLAHREVPIPIALRLFLPQEWTSDPDRCAAAGVPPGWQDYHTKGVIALAEIDRVIAAGVEPGVVVADAGYGKSAPFRHALSERGLRWAVGIPKNQKVYPPNVEIMWPDAKPVGRPRKHPVATAERVTVERHLAALGARAWRSVSWRRGTKGKLRAKFTAVRVKVADGPEDSLGRHVPGNEVWLVGERRRDGTQKYYLSNLPPETRRVDLARVIKARWACEQGHEQLNQEVGLSHFEGRSWLGLHHHALLAMLAFAFLQFTRLRRAFYQLKHGPPPTPSLPVVRRALLECLLAVRCRCPCCGVLVSVPVGVTK